MSDARSALLLFITVWFALFQGYLISGNAATYFLMSGLLDGRCMEYNEDVGAFESFGRRRLVRVGACHRGRSPLSKIRLHHVPTLSVVPIQWAK